MALTSKEKDKEKKKNKDKGAANTVPPKKQQKKITDSDGKGYFFCGAEGHQKKHCINYHAWHAKKGMLLGLVCSEVNLISVPERTWWLDSVATTHISVSMQGCLNYQPLNDGERYIYVGDDNKVPVEAIGRFRLLLRTGFFLSV